MTTDVQENGNIVLHNQAGARVSVFFDDEAGAPRDVTSAEFLFKTKVGIDVELIAGQDINEKVLVIEPNTFTEYLDKTVEFIVREESEVHKPIIWSARIVVTGW